MSSIYVRGRSMPAPGTADGSIDAHDALRGIDSTLERTAVTEPPSPCVARWLAYASDDKLSSEAKAPSVENQNATILQQRWTP